MKTLKKLWRKLMWLMTTRTTWQWKRRDFTQVRVGPGATYQTGAQKSITSPEIGMKLKSGAKSQVEAELDF